MKLPPSNQATHGPFNNQTTGRVITKTMGMQNRHVRPASNSEDAFSFISFRLISGLYGYSSTSIDTVLPFFV